MEEYGSYSYYFYQNLFEIQENQIFLCKKTNYRDWELLFKRTCNDTSLYFKNCIIHTFSVFSKKIQRILWLVLHPVFFRWFFFGFLWIKNQKKTKTRKKKFLMFFFAVKIILNNVLCRSIIMIKIKQMQFYKEKEHV